MNSSLPRTVLDAADVSAVTQLVLAERECRDLGRWARMRACFHPDAVVRISWFDGSGPEFVERSIDMARRGVRATHRLGPMAVRLNGDRAVASLGATIDIPGVLDGVDICLSSHARFLYRAERRDGRWRLARASRPSTCATNCIRGGPARRCTSRRRRWRASGRRTACCRCC